MTTDARQSQVFLTGFKSILPRFGVPQSQALDWIAAAHSAPDEDPRMKRAVMRFGCGPERIATRYSCLEDFTHRDWSRMRIFDLANHPAGKSAGMRTQFYAETVNEACLSFYSEDSRPPDSIIHVTCTGYVSPSGVQRLVARKGWGMQTQVFHAYHMGCYAALPSIRLAAGLLAAGKKSVDLVHTELCSLHLDSTAHDPEQLVVQTLFADGLIRYSVTQKLEKDLPKNFSKAQSGFEVLGSLEEIIPDSEDEMTWMASDHGMRMTLSRDIPERIGRVLKDFVERLFASANVDSYSLRGLSAPSALQGRAVFAVHPGGPRIIDQVQQLLALRDDQIEASNQILRERGNMSSATLPHIWQVILGDERISSGTPMVSLAFGPGLTISGMLLKKVAP